MEHSAALLGTCAEIVRKDDHDRYLTVLHTAAHNRGPLMALYAFNLEIAKTREFVSEPALGEIRLQWWRETIEELYAGHTPRQHDVVEALAQTIEKTALPMQGLMDLVDARSADLYDEQPSTFGDLEAYVRNTAGALQALAAQSLGGEGACLDAARKVGIAWGLTGLMRSIPFHYRQGRIYVPLQMMREAGLDDPSRPDDDQKAALASILGQISNFAHMQLSDARQLSQSVPASVRPALLLAPLAEGYLEQLKKVNFDPEALNGERGAMGRQWRLMWRNMTSRF